MGEKGRGRGRGEVKELVWMFVYACECVCECVDGWVKLYCQYNSLPSAFQYACLSFQEPFI